MEMQGIFSKNLVSYFNLDFHNKIQEYYKLITRDKKIMSYVSNDQTKYLSNISFYLSKIQKTFYLKNKYNFAVEKLYVFWITLIVRS